MDVMRAVFVRDFGGTEALSLDCTTESIPGPDDIVVDVQATAENFVDLLVIDGKYQFFPPLPFIPGKLPTGKIASIGSNIRDWNVEDRVLTLAEQGGYALRSSGNRPHSPATGR
jgi:NADPH:quinone reductase